MDDDGDPGTNDRRERWLNPPEWIDQLAAKIDAADTFEDVPKEGRPLVRQSAIMAAAKDARLKKRTLKRTSKLTADISLRHGIAINRIVLNKKQADSRIGLLQARWCGTRRARAARFSR